MTLSPGRERLLLGVALAALIVVGGLYSASALNTHDEAWFLQVVARVADGDVLYRDVFFGATPLSVYVTLPFVAVLGGQIALVKVVVVGAFAAALVIVVWTARLLGAGLWASLLLAAAMLVFAPPFAIGLYQPLATVFLLACLATTLVWQVRYDGSRPDPGRERRLILAAGVAAGLAFSSKQNVGVYTLAALLGAVALCAPGRRLRLVGLALGAFAACVLALLVPVVASGGFGRFVEYGFSNKQTYVERGGASYLDGLIGAGEAARDRITAGEGWTDVVYAVPYVHGALLYLAVPAFIALLALAWLRTEGVERQRTGVVGLYVLAAVLALYPRAAGPHLRFVAPVFLLAGWYALDLVVRELSRPRLRLGAIVIALVLVVGVAVRAAWPVLQVVDRDARLSTLPHARGILIAPERELSIRRTARVIARKAARGSIFLAAPEAGFYYLQSGVDNATPYDYPLVTAFGRTGEAELAARIDRGEFRTVCLRYRSGWNMAPQRLADAVRSSMERGRRLPGCTLFRFPAAAPDQ